MDGPKKDGDSKITDFSQTSASRKSAPCEKTHKTNLALPRGSFRSTAVLPDNINQLCECLFERPDYYRESLAAPAPPPASSQPDPHGIPSPNPLAFLVEKSQMFPSSESIDSIGERLQKGEIHPHILGVHYGTKQQSCRPQTVPTGPINKWFFRDLEDLQRKLFFGASKKSGTVKEKLQTSTDQNQELDAEEREKKD